MSYSKPVEIPAELIEKFELSSFCPDDAIRGQPQTGTAWSTIDVEGSDLYYVCHWNGEITKAVRAWGSASCSADAAFIKAAIKWFQSMTQAKDTADHVQCAVCKKWKSVETMLRPHGNTDDLCCDEDCCESWNERGCEQ